jgi:hypothetical protein
MMLAAFALVDAAWRVKAVRKNLSIVYKSARPSTTYHAVGTGHGDNVYRLDGVRHDSCSLHHSPGRLTVEDMVPLQGDIVGVRGHVDKLEYEG